MRYVLTIRGYVVLDHTYVDIIVTDDSVPADSPYYECWKTTLAVEDLNQPNPKRWARQVLERLATDA